MVGMYRWLKVYFVRAIHMSINENEYSKANGEQNKVHELSDRIFDKGSGNAGNLMNNITLYGCQGYHIVTPLIIHVAGGIK